MPSVLTHSAMPPRRVAQRLAGGLYYWSGPRRRRNLKPKHAIKQVDRLLLNPGIDVDAILVHWVPYIIGARTSIVVALDWTDFDADNQATILLALISDHGRSTPLVWLTVDKDTLRDHRNLYKHGISLAELLPAGITVCIVADRGFGDQKLYKMLTEELYFDYVIRFRGNISVTATTGETCTAAAWVRAGGGVVCCAAPRSPLIIIR